MQAIQSRREHLARLGLLASAVVLPACQGTGAGNWLAETAAARRRETYDQVQDRALVDALYVMRPDGATLVPQLLAANYALVRLRPDTLAMRQPMGNGGDNRGARELISQYVPNPEGDQVGQILRQVARARGNRVMAYKSRMGARLNRLFEPPMVMGGDRREYYDLDTPMIEWSPQGRVVSVLVHAVQSAASLGVLVTRYSSVYFGPTAARHVENNIRNSDFADFELREM